MVKPVWDGDIWTFESVHKSLKDLGYTFSSNSPNLKVGVHPFLI